MRTGVCCCDGKQVSELDAALFSVDCLDACDSDGEQEVLRTQAKTPEGCITGSPEKVPFRSLRLPAP